MHGAALLAALDMGCGASKMEKKRRKLAKMSDAQRHARCRKEGTEYLRGLPHSKARTSPYQGGTERFLVPDDKIPFSVRFKPYAPVEYTAPFVLKCPPWADKPDVSEVEFNILDVKARIDRCSFEGDYAIDRRNNRPINPRGRTGMTGRGLLGRFGPNHAADPVISKWKRSEDGELELDDKGRRKLEFVAVKRKDTGDWAIPGGMVDAGETVSLTLKREFGEETMDSLALNPEDRADLMVHLDAVFKKGIQVYSGYVDDIRNTDNAWMETTCVNFHDDDGFSFSKFKLKAGDDAGQVAWATYEKGMPLYATHTDFMRIVAAMHGVDYED